MDTPEAELDDAGRAEMEEALAEPTLCVAGAEPAAGPFPLVVYHGGLGSSFEDNAALCAYLASHGYVVLGSAFPRADGRSLNIDGFHGSAEDVQFLVRWADAHAFTDARRVGLVGHSAGAQAMLRFAAQPGCAWATRSCYSTRRRTTTPSRFRSSNRWCAKSPTASRR